MIHSKTVYYVFYVSMSLVIYWMLLYLGDMAMDPVFLFFPILLGIIFSFAVLNSYYSDNIDIGFYLLSFAIILGYVIKPGILDLFRDDRIYGTWRSLGRFNFSADQYLTLWSVTLFGSLGIIAGYFFSSWTKVKVYIKRENIIDRLKILNNHPCVFFIIWFLSAIFLNLILFSMGIGRRGLQTETVLPFHMAGGLHFVRIYIMIYILGLVLTVLYNKKKLRSWVLFLLIVEVVIDAFCSLSKMSFVFALFPLMVYYLTMKKVNVRSFVFFCSLLVMFSLFVVIINACRTFFYLKLPLDEIVVLHQGSVYDPLFFIEKVIDRIIGADGLMAVVGRPEFNSFGRFVRYHFGGWSEYVSGVYFGMPEREGLAWAKGMGLFGVLFISNSYCVVFLVCIAIIFCISLMEKLYKIKGLELLSMYSSTILVAEALDGRIDRFFTKTLPLNVLFFVSLYALSRINFMGKHAGKIFRRPYPGPSGD